MAAPHFVIIGNGSAGNCAAQTLREGDPDARLSIISAEPTQYLCRHHLAKFLATDDRLESLSILSPEWYEERNIALRLNQAVVKVNTAEKCLLMAHREKVRYDKLLICSGARHRIPEYLSHFEDLVTRFSNGMDALVLRERMDKINHVTLLGGDCVGLQLISALLPIGKKITLIMDEYRFWPLEFDEKTKNRLAGALAKKGVEVIGDDYVTDIERAGQGLSIETREGRKVETDEAITCSGMTPCLEYLVDSDIDMQSGVLVNERLEANEEDVWAAGECAQVYHSEINDYHMSTGYNNARSQGELAAKNMLGGSGEVQLPEHASVVIAGEKFTTYGWKGFTLDETD